MSDNSASRESSWSDVWAQRSVEMPVSALSLEELIRLDGFDVGAGAIALESWRGYASSIAARLGLGREDSVFEIGCGAGALLVAMQEEVGVRVGGMDFSSALIEVAQRALPSGRFFVADATAPPVPGD